MFFQTLFGKRRSTITWRFMIEREKRAQFLQEKMGSKFWSCTHFSLWDFTPGSRICKLCQADKRFSRPPISLKHAFAESTEDWHGCTTAFFNSSQHGSKQSSSTSFLYWPGAKSTWVLNNSTNIYPESIGCLMLG